MQKGIAPVWLGEFGCSRPGRWWRHIMRYIRANQLDFAYWSIDGQKKVGENEGFGLLK